MAAHLRIPFSLFATLAIAGGAARCFCADVEVPKGITYKTVDQKTDIAARKAVADAFAGGSAKIFALFAPSVQCGPGYWGMIGSDPAIQTVYTIPADFKIPNTTTSEIKTLKGAMFKDDRAKQALAGRLASDAGTHPKIRKLRPEELRIYWAMIPFDIQEPVYILESGDKRYLLNLTADKGQFSIMWVDELSQFSFANPKSFLVTNIVLYQPDAVLTKRVPSVDLLAAYIKQLEAVAQEFFNTAKKPETLHIVVAVRPGGLARVWFVSSTRADDAKEFAPLRKKLEAVTPPDVNEGPVAFAISTQLAGGDSHNPMNDKNFKPPIPKEWDDAVKDKKADIPVPDGFLDAVWPAPKTKPPPSPAP